MSQSKTEFHSEEILRLVQEIRQDQNPKFGSDLSAKLDWIAFHARQLEVKCKECADSPNGSKNET